jgi:hypothetical protein
MSAAWWVDLAVVGEGPWKVYRQGAQKAHPLFYGDTDVPELWGCDGPGEMAQLFRTEQAAITVCAALNALHRLYLEQEKKWGAWQAGRNGAEWPKPVSSPQEETRT